MPDLVAIDGDACHRGGEGFLSLIIFFCFHQWVWWCRFCSLSSFVMMGRLIRGPAGSQ